MKNYDTTVARMAGNIAAGMSRLDGLGCKIHPVETASECVHLARCIIAETIRTEPPAIPIDVLSRKLMERK